MQLVTGVCVCVCVCVYNYCVLGGGFIGYFIDPLRGTGLETAHVSKLP